METLSSGELFSFARLLSDGDLMKSPYTHNAIVQGLDNYRIFSMNEVVVNKLADRIPVYLLKHLNEAGESVVIANKLAGEVISLVFRGLHQKAFSVYGTRKSMFYGLGMLPGEFKYGDPIVVVEGTLDRDALLPICSNVMAVLTSSMSMLQLEVIQLLTNHVILLYDNDVTGKKSTAKDYARLIKRNINVSRGCHPVSVKDSGELAKIRMTDPYGYEKLRKYYEDMINLLKR
jgi:5S rRNA maturation endonuclease (ribonuclease M5)